MVLRKFPHQVLRENKQATGAGADRVSDGMRQPSGRSSAPPPASSRRQLFTAYCDVEDAEHAKEALPPCLQQDHSFVPHQG